MLQSIRAPLPYVCPERMFSEPEGQQEVLHALGQEQMSQYASVLAPQTVCVSWSLQVSFLLVCRSRSVYIRIHRVRTGEEVAKMNASNRSDLLCGRSADYLARKGHFPMFVCSVITVGGRWTFGKCFSPLPLKHSQCRKQLQLHEKVPVNQGVTKCCTEFQ